MRASVTTFVLLAFGVRSFRLTSCAARNSESRRGSARRVMSAASRPEDFDEMVLSARVGRQLHIGDTIALCVQRGGTTYCVSSEGFVELSCSLREVR